MKAFAKTFLSTSVVAASLLAGAGLSAVSYADDAPASTFTGNVGFVSNYMFRAISQTYNQPALQGGFDYVDSSGFYVGTWASNVSGNLYMNGAGMELDVYGGYKFTPVEDLTFDMGLYGYYYPGAHYNDIHKTKYNNGEVYVAASYKWLSLKYSHALTDYFGVNEHTYGGYMPVINNHGGVDPTQALPANRGDSKGSGYVDLKGTFTVADKTTLVAHVGYAGIKNYGELSYTDYSLGITHDFGWATIGATAIGSDASSKWYRYCESSLTSCEDPTRTAVVLSLVRAL